MAETPNPELIVTNYRPNFTGVSATAAQLISVQEKCFNMLLSGYGLPSVQSPPLSVWRTFLRSRKKPPNRKHVIWHVRRNVEMLCAIIARDILRMPVKIVFTSAAIRRHSALPRYYISKMDAVIATTPKAAELVPHVVAVVPHGVDTDRFQPSADRAAQWRETGFPGKVGIATVGHVKPEKGTDLFVESMIRVLPDHPDVTALVIGRVDARFAVFKSRLEAKIEAAGLKDRIRFLGEVANTEMPKLFSALSLLVALPRYEGFGMTPLEAMSSGVPVVASDTGAFSTFLADGKCGSLVELDNLEQATAAISEALQDREALDQMGKSARQAAVNKFSLEAEAREVAAVYQQVWD